MFWFVIPCLNLIEISLDNMAEILPKMAVKQQILDNYFYF